MKIKMTTYFLSIVFFILFGFNFEVYSSENKRLPWDSYAVYFDHSKIDILKVTRQCLLRDTQAMSILFEYQVTGNLDGAAGEAYSNILVKLLRWLGDEFFGNCLLKESKEIQEQVRIYIHFDLDSSTKEKKQLTEYLYPLTLKGQSIYR